MLKILPAIEGFVLANIATQNLFDANPLEFLLGDLNQDVGMNPNMLQLAMGPSSAGAISLKEILTGSMNIASRVYVPPTVAGKSGTYKQGYAQVGGVLDQVQTNFMDNMGNIIIGTVASTAGFRIAKKVLRKPINMANRQLRNAGLGSTVQF
jgi:hypothetical protein